MTTIPDEPRLAFIDLRQHPESVRIETSPACRCPEATILVMKSAHAPPQAIIPAPAGHSCAYVKARNALIPIAERKATWDVGRHSPHWSRAFVKAMEELAAEAYRAGRL